MCWAKNGSAAGGRGCVRAQGLRQARGHAGAQRERRGYEHPRPVWLRAGDGVELRLLIFAGEEIFPMMPSCEGGKFIPGRKAGFAMEASLGGLSCCKSDGFRDGTFGASQVPR